ncbi:hypothetical protein ACV34S_34985, partial [Pseudomonas aeruginosa]
APRDSAAQAASAVAESVRYQGRKASRQGSEQRRQAILDAAMRLIVRDGVRAVRHRAVAHGPYAVADDQAHGGIENRLAPLLAALAAGLAALVTNAFGYRAGGLRGAVSGS